MEAIIQICHASEANGIDEEVKSGFMNHERAEELIKGLVKIYLEQLDTLIGLVQMNCAATAQLAFEYDISKHLLL